MSAALRRGACPSLAAPMRTGDGWLARLSFTEGLTGAQLAGLAAVAARLGNGLIEVTARGSLQIRGLAEGAPLAAAVAPLGLPLAEGVPMVTSPLAGCDPAQRGGHGRASSATASATSAARSSSMLLRRGCHSPRRRASAKRCAIARAAAGLSRSRKARTPASST